MKAFFVISYSGKKIMQQFVIKKEISIKSHLFITNVKKIAQ